MSKRVAHRQHPYPDKAAGETLSGWCITGHFMNCPYVIRTQAGYYLCGGQAHIATEHAASRASWKIIEDEDL